ncbi:hypothetical protein ACWEWU_10840 [Staphylococcus xylosus]
MNKENIKNFLEFREQFTPKEWLDLELAVKAQYRKKARELKLDEKDISEIIDEFDRKKNSNLMQHSNHPFL